MTDFLIYGSYGYTGSLLVEQALKAGLQPLLAGRDAEKLAAQARNFGLPAVPFDLSNTEALEAALRRVALAIHCAGPFVHTYRSMVEACLRTGRHYLDISGEIPGFEALAGMSEQASAKGITLMPGAGFDVVPSDCLAAHLKRRLPTATTLKLYIRSVKGGVSRGTARSAVENMQRGGMLRRDGSLIRVPAAAKTVEVDFGRGPVKAVLVGWGDVSTAFHSTGIPNVEVYMALPRALSGFMKSTRWLGWLLYTRPVKEILKAAIGLFPPGPSREQNRTGFSLILGEVADANGNRAAARLKTPESYYLTALTSLAIARRVLEGDFKPGFATPSMAYGPDFILEFDGVERNDE
ncbi:MAG: saccharopine dehydrogenase family protein [Chloroflexota bacterium]